MDVVVFETLEVTAALRQAVYHGGVHQFVGHEKRAGNIE